MENLYCGHDIILNSLGIIRLVLTFSPQCKYAIITNSLFLDNDIDELNINISKLIYIIILLKM